VRISEVTHSFCKQNLQLAFGAVLLCALAACNSTVTGSGGAAGASGTDSITALPTGSATVTWIAPSQNADGSPLTNLAGFHVYYGSDANVLSTLQDVPQPGISSTVVANLKSGTYFFAVSAYTADGAESELSAVVSKQIS
jgi:hypothetical protein